MTATLFDAARSYFCAKPAMKSSWPKTASMRFPRSPIISQVIFVDIMMPRLDGYQTCALIKQNPQLKSTPVIMLSSKDGVFDRARGRLAGSDRYLTKTFTKEGLIEAVNEYVKPASLPT